MAKHTYHIDRDQLAKHGACDYWRERFDKDFPDGFTVNEDNVRKALKLGYPLSWVAYRLSDAHDNYNDEQDQSVEAMDLGVKLGHIQGRRVSQDAVRKAHDLMHHIGDKWTAFKVAHPEWLPSSY